MADTSLLLHYSRFAPSFRSLFFIPTCLALFTSLFILFYISTTSNLFFTHHHRHRDFRHYPSTPTRLLPQPNPSLPLSASPPKARRNGGPVPPFANFSNYPFVQLPKAASLVEDGGQRSSSPLLGSNNGGIYVNNAVFHDKDIFQEDYKEMNRRFKIYVYPHRKNDPFANALLPVNFEPGGNYASESFFKKVLMKSRFITKDPTKADLFFLPFSIANLRHDRRVSVGGIPYFVRDYIFNISQKYPYWNRTGGADHFYVACHSIGRSAMDKAEEVKFNAIQVVCSSSYFLSGYLPHKDASLPQVWPRQGDPPNVTHSKRKKLAFFAGAINSPIRQTLLRVWRNDSEIDVHFGRLKTPYADALLGSKFCLHVKGYEVNTARIADSIYYGCVPVIIANYYDLPFADVLNWKSFSVVVSTLDIPLLKKILKEISFDRYLLLRKNVLKVQKHFQWHVSPVEFDAFYMTMYELWLRRSSVKIPFDSVNLN